MQVLRENSQVILSAPDGILCVVLAQYSMAKIALQPPGGIPSSCYFIISHHLVYLLTRQGSLLIRTRKCCYQRASRVLK